MNLEPKVLKHTIMNAQFYVNHSYADSVLLNGKL